MAISHELSSEIATALLTDDRSPEELKALKNVVLEVHSTLQALGDDAGRNKHTTQPTARPSKSQGRAALSNS